MANSPQGEGPRTPAPLGVVPYPPDLLESQCRADQNNSSEAVLGVKGGTNISAPGPKWLGTPIELYGYATDPFNS